MGDNRLELEAQRKNIKRYEDLCAFGVLFSLLMLFNDGPAKMAGYAIAVFAWFWWSNRSKRQELDRQIHQHEQAELIAAAVAARSPGPADESPSPHSSSSDPRPPPEAAATPAVIGGVAPQIAPSFRPAKSATGKVCPKCRHQRSENDDLHVPDWQCPACGIAYAKFKPGQRQLRPDVPLEISTGRRVASLAARVLGWCLVIVAAIFILIFAMMSQSEPGAGSVSGVFLVLLILGLPGLGLLFVAESLGPRRASLAQQSREHGANKSRPGEAKPPEGPVAFLGMVVLLVAIGNISLVLMYGTMAPCRAAAKRIVAASYDDMPPAETAAEQFGRKLGQSWAQAPLERLVYADMATGSVLHCYAVAFRVAKPVSRSKRQ